MSDTRKHDDLDVAWDVGDLGRDPNHVRVFEGVDESKIDEAVGLVPVSIRLQKTLIEDFKFIAELNGIGYQPLMRQILTRFAESEKKRILRDAVEAHRKAIEEEEDQQEKQP